MAAIPESTRSSVALRLLDHAEQHWPQLRRVQVTSRAGFAYVTGILPDGEQIPLCRLRYGGSAHSFGFAIYSAARARYEDAVLLTGSPVGTPQEALDTACTVHLAGLGHEPPTNLRAHPLKAAAGCLRQPCRCTGRLRGGRPASCAGHGAERPWIFGPIASHLAGRWCVVSAAWAITALAGRSA